MTPELREAWSLGLSRRQLLKSAAVFGGGIAGAGLLAACNKSAPSSSSGGSSPGKTSIKFQQSWLNNVEFAGIYAAIQNGYYGQHNLAVSPNSGGTNIDPRSVVANGAALIGSVAEGSDVALAVSQGVDVKAFAASFQVNPGCLMVLEDSGINSVQDLRGKTIGLQNSARQQVQGILAHNNIPEKDVKLQIVGNDATPLVEKKIDAYTAFAFNEPVALDLKGIKTRLLFFSDIGLPAYGDVYIASSKTIEEKPDVLKAFLEATRQGWQWTLTNSKASADLTLKYFAKDQDAAQQAEQMQVSLPMLQSDDTKANGLMSMDTEVWQGTIDALQAQNTLKKPVTVDQVMTLEVLKSAG